MTIREMTALEVDMFKRIEELRAETTLLREENAVMEKKLVSIVEFLSPLPSGYTLQTLANKVKMIAWEGPGAGIAREGR